MHKLFTEETDKLMCQKSIFCFYLHITKSTQPIKCRVTGVVFFFNKTTYFSFAPENPQKQSVFL